MADNRMTVEEYAEVMRATHEMGPSEQSNTAYCVLKVFVGMMENTEAAYPDIELPPPHRRLLAAAREYVRAYEAL
jgi:hypothetical protein